MKNNNKYRFLFAGGGTGGHIFPAIAVAEKIREIKPQAEFLFIGTKSRIEAIVVPKMGFKFKSIWIKGFARKFNLENILFPIKVIAACIQSLLINMKFRPSVAIGSGGYVSGPAIWGASILGARIILLEQNSYPGITTRILEKKSDEVHLSFEDTKKYLKHKEKLYVTGNPVRTSLSLINKSDALKRFGLSASRKTLLILGGSLGAGSINKITAASIETFSEIGIQVIWQTGKNYFNSYKVLKRSNIWINDFIDDMAAAYSACDLCVSRAGATTIAEIANLGISVIFIPSPNVAANHQYYNAKSLSDKGAAILIKDSDLDQELTKQVASVIFDERKLLSLSENVKLFAKPDAAEFIAKRAIVIAESL